MLDEANQSGSPIAPNEAFLKVVGGRKRGGVPGLGSGADIVYQSDDDSSRSSRSISSCSPSFIFQLQNQVQQLKDHCEERVFSLTKTYEERLAAQEENMRRMEEFMTKFIGAVRENCGNSLPGDLFRPRGPGPEGGSGSFPAGVAAV